MERVITNHRILTYLSRLDDQLIISNRSGENTLAKACESLIRDLFSIIYSQKFLNVNLNISNFPAIDLHQPESRIAIQVTSNRADEKIIDSFDKFFKYKLEQEYDKLIIIILGNKRFELDKLDKKYTHIKQKYSVTFTADLKNDLLDLTSLYNLISQQIDANKVNEILTLLKSYFDEFKGVKSLEPYYEELKKNFFEVVMDDPKGITLNSIYIDPAFLIHKTSGNKNSKDLIESHDFFRLNKEVTIHQLLNARLAGDPAYDGLFNSPESKLTFILGYPGQGKTSFCSKLLFDQLTIPRTKNIFYLKLRNISDTQSLIHNPFNVIYNELENQFGGEFNKTMLKNSITILDGLDELYMKDNLSANDIETFCKDLIREAEKHKDWQLIITTRHGYVNFERLYKEPYVAIILKPLDPLRQKMWLQAYQQYYPETWFTIPKLIELYQSRIKRRRSHILELIDQPLLLYIVASLDNEIDTEANRSDLYNKLFDQIIDRRYSKDGQIENLKRLSKEDLRTMLQEIAFLIFESGNEYVTTNEILHNENMENYLEKIGDNHLSGTLKGILISFYFKERMEDIEKGEPAGIEFFHKSLQEYLTAERIVEMMFRSLLNKDQYGAYVIKKNIDFLNLFNDIFGKMDVTSEIKIFIEELILKRSREEKSELSKRMTLPIEFLFEKDFLNSSQIEEKNPFEKSMLTFSSYWHFLQCLGEKVNYLTSRSACTKFNAYINYISLSDHISEFDKRINHQILHSLDLQHWFQSDEDLIGARFMHCTGYDVGFYDLKISDVHFQGCDFTDLSIGDSKTEGLRLFKNRFYTMRLQNIKGTKIVFEECEFTSTIVVSHVRKHFIVFKNSIFHEEAFESLTLTTNNIKLINCKLRKYVRTNKKLPSTEVDTPIENSPN